MIFRNLTGVREADESVQEELYLADINRVRIGLSKGEVPYTIMGKLGHWDFYRIGNHWAASAPDGGGFSLRFAMSLHNQTYPLIGLDQPETFGEVIRVAGCEQPIHPKDWALPKREVLDEGRKRLRVKNNTHENLVNLCTFGQIQGERFVNSYDIDTQVGLNEFAKTIRIIWEEG